MYDLASLLCDPYVELPDDAQNELARCYAERSGASLDLFWTAAVQRLVQALGAYGRLAALPGAGRFRAHIPAALRMLDRALPRAGAPLPRLRALVARRLGAPQ